VPGVGGGGCSSAGNHVGRCSISDCAVVTTHRLHHTVSGVFFCSNAGRRRVAACGGVVRDAVCFARDGGRERGVRPGEDCSSVSRGDACRTPARLMEQWLWLANRRRGWHRAGSLHSFEGYSVRRNDWDLMIMNAVHTGSEVSEVEFMLGVEKHVLRWCKRSVCVPVSVQRCRSEPGNCGKKAANKRYGCGGGSYIVRQDGKVVRIFGARLWVPTPRRWSKRCASNGKTPSLKLPSAMMNLVGIFSPRFPLFILTG
jgi:hypothetical protein